MSEEAFIGRHEAAKRLGVHPHTVYRWTVKGLLKAHKLPTGGFRYRVSDIEALADGTGPQAQRVAGGRLVYPDAER